MYVYVKWQTKTIAHETIWIWIRREENWREEINKSLLIVAHINVIRNIYIKAKTDDIQKNTKCRLCGDREETINLMIRECDKRVQVGRKGDPPRIVQKNKICPYWQMVLAQTRNCHGKRDSYNSLGLWDTNRSVNPDQKTSISNNLRTSLLRCGTRPNEWGTQWDSNSLM